MSEASGPVAIYRLGIGLPRRDSVANRSIDEFHLVLVAVVNSTARLWSVGSPSAGPGPRSRRPAGHPHQGVLALRDSGSPSGPLRVECTCPRPAPPRPHRPQAPCPCERLASRWFRSPPPHPPRSVSSIGDRFLAFSSKTGHHPRSSRCPPPPVVPRGRTRCLSYLAELGKVPPWVETSGVVGPWQALRLGGAPYAGWPWADPGVRVDVIVARGAGR